MPDRLAVLTDHLNSPGLESALLRGSLPTADEDTHDMETSRQRFLRTLNSRYLYGKVVGAFPLLSFYCDDFTILSGFSDMGR